MTLFILFVHFLSSTSLRFYFAQRQQDHSNNTMRILKLVWVVFGPRQYVVGVQNMVEWRAAVIVR